MALPGWPWWYAPLALLAVYAATYAIVVPLHHWQPHPQEPRPRRPIPPPRAA